MERSEEEKKISVLDAMHMIASSWSAVSQSTIANSFKHCGFVRETVSTAGDTTSSMEEDSSAIDDDDFERLNPTTTFAVEADDNVATCGELSLDEAIAEEFPGAEATATSDEDDAAATAADAAVPTSFADMLRHMDGIRSYVCTRDATEDVLLDIAKLEGEAFEHGLKESAEEADGFFLSACHVSRRLWGIAQADGGTLKSIAISTSHLGSSTLTSSTLLLSSSSSLIRQSSWRSGAEGQMQSRFGCPASGGSPSAPWDVPGKRVTLAMKPN
ncbi:hypothetical protein MTO96_046674 [Rhipicephalus appendiculatus]